MINTTIKIIQIFTFINNKKSIYFLNLLNLVKL